MIKYMVKLESVSKVKEFVNTISNFDYDFELISGSYTLNAKSIMGIFSLDLSSPIELIVNCDSSNPDLESRLDPFIVQQI